MSTCLPQLCSTTPEAPMTPGENVTTPTTTTTTTTTKKPLKPTKKPKPITYHQPDKDFDFYLERIWHREEEISAKIQNIQDPIDAIKTIRNNEGQNLKALWESEAGYPIDGVLLCIILLPIGLGVLGSYIASIWEPKLVGEELYDDYGNRIVEYPKMSIAYLQQSRKDQSTARENRNSLAWLCHTWLISTNDVVQELQAPFPLEENTTTGWGTVKALARLYGMIRETMTELKAAQDVEKKEMQVEEAKKADEAELDENYEIDDDDDNDDEDKDETKKESKKRPSPSEPKKKEGKLKSIFKKSQVKDIIYIQSRLVPARRLWAKLNEWIDEYYERPLEKIEHSSDQDDSYWSSSETFSSDSGEHWKNYAANTQAWARKKKLEADWKLEVKRRRYKPPPERVSEPQILDEPAPPPPPEKKRKWNEISKNAYKKVKDKKKKLSNVN